MDALEISLVLALDVAKKVATHVTFDMPGSGLGQIAVAEAKTALQDCQADHTQGQPQKPVMVRFGIIQIINCAAQQHRLD